MGGWGWGVGGVLQREKSRFLSVLTCLENIGALMIRIELWCILYYSDDKEPLHISDSDPQGPRLPDFVNRELLPHFCE